MILYTLVVKNIETKYSQFEICEQVKKSSCGSKNVHVIRKKSLHVHVENYPVFKVHEFKKCSQGSH
jgi:hypothetical protein